MIYFQTKTLRIRSNVNNLYRKLELELILKRTPDIYNITVSYA